MRLQMLFFGAACLGLDEATIGWVLSRMREVGASMDLYDAAHSSDLQSATLKKAG